MRCSISVAFASLLALAPTGCVMEDDLVIEAEQQPSQCGDTLDFQDVETYDGSYGVSQQFVPDHERAVGRASMGCSGTLVAPGIFLSAGHCDYQVGDSVTFDFQVNGATGEVRPGESFDVVEVIAQKDSFSNDYAIVRLEDEPGDAYGIALMTKRNPDDAERLVIIGHPDSMPKQVSVGYPDGDIINGSFFDHTVDTLPGNSGSGVCDGETRDDGAAVVDDADRVLACGPVEADEVRHVDSLAAGAGASTAAWGACRSLTDRRSAATAPGRNILLPVKAPRALRSGRSHAGLRAASELGRLRRGAGGTVLHPRGGGSRAQLLGGHPWRVHQ